ncbi:uncharacterized protein LOC119546694 [Drosophila subpulchrella]|uniref:uncharacterized protein LOC119546694 n=1 Tax=Drosophila subpulchrella TaxID=1486046 RepID=UPI0018A14EC2|nr:uncharacterized protein LOC119546694 [Drosophila subpulchrella]
MELRSRTTKKLVDFLKSAGVYEADMEIEEMRELASVMEQSASCKPEDQELEKALQESELEFLSSQPSAMHNSTMIMSPQVSRRDPADLDSPPSEPIRVTIRACVHHPMDWSPTAERRIPDRKRAAGGNDNQATDLNGKRIRPPAISSAQEKQDQEQQPENPDATPVSLGNEGDSGVSWEEMSLSSASDNSSFPSIGEMPDRHLISTSSVAVSDFSDIHEQSQD